MASHPRYALYYVPAPGSDLDRFGASLLGYDVFGGKVRVFPETVVEAVRDWPDLTRDPRKYGFHATLKAPFALADGYSEADLLAACKTFAATPRPIPVITPVVNPISGFIAMVPAEPSPQLSQLAADCVREFDALRAPLTAEDRARRKPEALTPAQIEHLDHWGYPYVMDDFRFHMTLTGRVAAERRDELVALLRRQFDQLNLKTLAIDRIGIFRQEETDSRFRVLAHFALANVRATQPPSSPGSTGRPGIPEHQ